MSSSQIIMRSASVRCPEMGSNASICATNSEWTFFGFVSGREGVVLAAKQNRSLRDGVYHKTMWRNLKAIMKSKRFW